MDDLIDLDELLRRAPMRGLGDYHLRSALHYVETEELEQRSGRWREQKAYDLARQAYKDFTFKSGEPVHLMQQLIQDRTVGSPNSEIIGQKELITLLSIEFSGLRNMRFPNDLFQKALELISSNCWKPSSYSHLKIAMVRLILFCMAKTSNRQLPDVIGVEKTSGYHTFKYGESCELIILGELIGQKHPTERVLFLYNMDHIRMVCDKVTERDNIMSATYLGHKLLPTIYPPTMIISKVFSCFDRYLTVHGNRGYSVVKVFEALVTGVLLARESSRYWDSRKFLLSTLSDLDDEDRDICHEMVDIIASPELTAHHLMQICGLFRSWGHPVINSKSGMRKVREIGTAKKAIDTWTSSLAGWKFLEIFFVTYYGKEKRYPEFSIHHNSRITYLQTQLLNRDPINKKHPEYNLHDWEVIDLEKTFDVPASFNLSMIIADTAISPTRTELYKSSSEGNAGLDPVQRRGVLKWMKDGVLECRPLLESVDQNPTGLEKDHLIIGLYPKEREQNVKPRMFALMTLIMRAVMVVTEAMLADHVLPYVPGVTMTHSMLQLQKQMIKLTMKQKSLEGTSITFCISIDFEKWNLNMRKAGTQHLFRQLGRLFGLETLYNKTYDIFSNSIIYLADGSYKLKINEDLELIETDLDLAYTDHQGGFEGLRQKGWTIFTVAIISAICDKLNIEWRLMGQGDNQVLMVTIHSKEAREFTLSSDRAAREINGILGNLLSELEETFGLVGLPLKPLETWISENFFSYGKVPIYRGIPLSMSLKRISRVFFFSNEDLMTLDNALGSISTNAQAAAMNDPLPIIPYIIAKWQHIQCVKVFLNYHPLIGSKPINDDSDPSFTMYDEENRKNVHFSSSVRAHPDVEKLMIVLVPKTLGGFNILTFFEMISRGFSDPPNRDYQYLWMMYQNAEESELKLAIFNCLNLHINNKINYSYLLSDPTGLNLLVPTNSSTAVKQMIHRVIDKLSFDSQFSLWFKELLKLSSTEEIKELCNCLTKTDQLNVRFLHDIVGSTLHGYSDAISSKVDKTVTLSRIALGSEDVVMRLVNNEKRFINYFLWRIVEPGNFPYTEECPSLYIRKARREGWDKDILGVDVPYPYHFLSLNEDATDRPDSFVEVLISDQGLSNRDVVTNSIGHALPYLGSVTKEKVLQSPIRAAYGTEPLITRPLRLLRSIGWFVSPSSNFADLLEKLVQAVCDLDPADLVYIPDEVKGSMIHRYSDFATKHGALYLPLYGPATFLNISTNNFLEYSKGSKNVTLHFQALLCYVQIVAVSSLLSALGCKSLKYYRCCPDCITPVVEDFQDLPDPVDISMIPSRPDNPYLYMKEDQIPLTIQSKVQETRSLHRINLDQVVPEVLYNNLVTWLCLRIMGDFHNETSLGDDLLDISSIDRTIFLKLSPVHVVERLTILMWVRTSAEKKYGTKSYPSWKIVQRDILRSLERVPSRGFTIFSGFYLWDESMCHLRGMNALFPATYPMTPGSIAESSKLTIINAIKQLDELPRINMGERILFSDAESDLSMLLKVGMLIDSDGMLKKCPWCISAGVQIRRIDRRNLKDIFHLRCNVGHNLMNFYEYLRTKYLYATPISAAFDEIPKLAPPISSPQKGLLQHIGTISNKPIVSSDDILSWGEESAYLALEKLYFSNTGVNLYKIGLPFRYPTDSLFGVSAIGAGISGRDKFKSVIVLGDGFGYSSLAAMSLFPKATIWSWTLIDISKAISHSARSSLPPTHFYFNHSRVKYDLTFDQPSDIGSIRWEESLANAIRDKGADFLVSEVELWYTDENLFGKFMDSIYNARPQHALIKLNFSTQTEFVNLIVYVSQRYIEWKIFDTVIDHMSTGTCWIYLGKKFLNPTSKYPDDQSIMIMLEKVIVSMRSQYFNSMPPTEFIVKTSIRELKKDKSFIAYQRNSVDVWFSHHGLSGWDSIDFTPLFNRIRTGKRPVHIVDLTGSDIYYLRETDEEEIAVRLISLASSLMQSPLAAWQLVRQKWKIVWKKRTTSRGWEVYLKTDERKRARSEQVQKSMMMWGRTMRELREISHKDKAPSFNHCNKTIRFSYIPFHKRAGYNICTFYISKIASMH